jgi:hypothetical protein
MLEQGILTTLKHNSPENCEQSLVETCVSSKCDRSPGLRRCHDYLCNIAHVACAAQYSSICHALLASISGGRCCQGMVMAMQVLLQVPTAVERDATQRLLCFGTQRLHMTHARKLHAQP